MREGRWGGSSGTEGRELQMTAWWRAGAGIQKAFFSLGNGKDQRCAVIKEGEVRLLQRQHCFQQAPQSQKQQHLSSPPTNFPAPLPTAATKFSCSLLLLVIECLDKMDSNYMHVQRGKIKLDCSILYGFYKILMYVVEIDGKPPPQLEGRALL